MNTFDSLFHELEDATHRADEAEIPAEEDAAVERARNALLASLGPVPTSWVITEDELHERAVA